MHSKLVHHWSLALHFLLLMIGYAIAEETSLNQNEGTHHHHHHHHEVSHSTTPHMDHSVLVFFTLNDLKVGKTMPIFFRGTKPSSSSPHFLPREEAELVPFSLSKLPVLLQHFGFSRTSSQATAMEDTLRQCEMKPILGETKSCATSLESMLDFVRKIFGLSTKFRALNKKEIAQSRKNILQNYTIVDEPREIQAPKMVACHTMPYPYVVYYCHYQVSESKVFQVTLRGEDGSNDNNIVEAVAVCHLDTSQWSSNHVSFRVLGIKPGSSPVCHFFPSDNLVWVPLIKSGHEGLEDN